MEELVRPELLEELDRRLDSFEIDGVMDSGIVEHLAEENWLSPFPVPDIGAPGQVPWRSSTAESWCLLTIPLWESCSRLRSTTFCR
ncbi:MAG: spore germination protein [Blautia marasmi]